MSSIVARESRSPLAARLAPVAYLGLCAAAVIQVVRLHQDVGVYGILVAMGLIPALIIPVAFSARNVRLSAIDGRLSIDGDETSLTEVAVDKADRGQAVLRIVTSAGNARAFTIATMRLAEELAKTLRTAKPAPEPTLGDLVRASEAKIRAMVAVSKPRIEIAR